MKPAPIYLLVNGKEDGPHDAEDLQERIEADELDDETLSCIEGMPGWRSLPETFIWAHGGLLAPAKAEIKAQIKALLDAETSIAPARTKVSDALLNTISLCPTLTGGIIGTVLETNCELQRIYKQYTNRDQHWDISVRLGFPALELLPFGKQKFVRDWPAVWQAAGGNIYNGKMIARHDDPVWLAISDFGFPFPPFSFDTMMWVQSVNYEECKKLEVPDLDRPMHLPEISKIKLVGIQK